MLWLWPSTMAETVIVSSFILTSWRTHLRATVNVYVIIQRSELFQLFSRFSWYTPSFLFLPRAPQPLGPAPPSVRSDAIWLILGSSPWLLKVKNIYLKYFFLFLNLLYGNISIDFHVIYKVLLLTRFFLSGFPNRPIPLKTKNLLKTKNEFLIIKKIGYF